MRRVFPAPAIVVVFIAVLVAASDVLGADAAEAEPRMQDFSWMTIEQWKAKHLEDMAVAKAGDVDLLFVGDSITDGWDAQAMWKERIAPLRAANFGVGGDTTQNVLWRLENGAVGNLRPKAVVLLIGTHNFGRNGDSPADVVRGIGAIAGKLGEAFPSARILVLGIFPRDASPNAVIRQQVREVNLGLKPLDDGVRVFVRDIGSIFLEADGTISTEIMPDLLHLSPEGYRRWGLAMLPMILPWLE
ncbi:MAG: GDSL-type esterase/lipase family protein [Opitutaceae bacterium]